MNSRTSRVCRAERRDRPTSVPNCWAVFPAFSRDLPTTFSRPPAGLVHVQLPHPPLDGGRCQPLHFPGCIRCAGQQAGGFVQPEPPRRLQDVRGREQLGEHAGTADDGRVMAFRLHPAGGGRRWGCSDGDRGWGRLVALSYPTAGRAVGAQTSPGSRLSGNASAERRML